MVEIKLKVEEARRSDVGRQIARISSEIADELGVKTGDVIEITGRRSTYAKVWRSSSIDIGYETIRIENMIRQNARVSLDDYVMVKPAKVNESKSVYLTPIQQIKLNQNLIPYLSRALVDKILSKGDIVAISTGFGGIIYLAVVKSDPTGPVIFTPKTSLTIVDPKTAKKEMDTPTETNRIMKVSYEDIGGLGDSIKKIREMIELPLRHPEIFERLGIQPPKGVLLYGPPGTGKTLLAKAIASETNSHFISIGGPEIMSKFYGESEGKLREIFEEANENAPSIIFIDEIDSIAPQREEVTGEVERRIVAQLLSLMDGLQSRGDVVVIAATNRPDSIDPALRRGGRFDRELEIGIPDEPSRLEILQIHTRGMPLEQDVDLNSLANRTHGFVGADLQILAKEAALSSLRRFLPGIDLSKDQKSLDPETLQKLKITKADFENGLLEVSPSALREVFVEVPNIHWNDIGGLDDVKKTLKETIEWPLKYSKVFDKLNATPSTGILLFGPPGTGKTMLAKAVANEANANFISIKGPELLSKWVGDSEKGVREIFRKARSAAPCIIFFDEIDSIAKSRSSGSSDSGVTERVVSQLLTEIDGLEEMKGVTILAATNRPDLIDPALMRPGRFDQVISVGNPDEESRTKILEVHLKETNLSKEVKLKSLSKQTEGWSGAEVAAYVERTKMIAIREFIELNINVKQDIDDLALNNLILTLDHFNEAFKEMNLSPKENYELKPPGLSDVSDNSFL